MGYNKDGIGYRNTDTSLQGANWYKGHKATIRDKVRQLFVGGKKFTTPEMVKILGHPEVSLQPRVTELKNEGYLRDSNVRKRGEYGIERIVWELNPDEGVNEWKITH